MYNFQMTLDMAKRFFGPAYKTHVGEWLITDGARSLNGGPPVAQNIFDKQGNRLGGTLTLEGAHEVPDSVIERIKTR